MTNSSSDRKQEPSMTDGRPDEFASVAGASPAGRRGVTVGPNPAGAEPLPLPGMVLGVPATTPGLGWAQLDRASGALVGLGVGDAVAASETDVLDGWSAATQSGLCAAFAVADHRTVDDVVEQTGRNFIDWVTQNEDTVPARTRTVVFMTVVGVDSVGAELVAGPMAAVAGHEGGIEPAAVTGGEALPRAGVAGLAAVSDRHLTATMARRFAELTHPDDGTVAASILLAESVRVAVTEGRLDPAAGVDLLPAGWRPFWEQVIADVDAGTGTGLEVGSAAAVFAAAWGPVWRTRHLGGVVHVREAVTLARSSGAAAGAVAGFLVGAVAGRAGLPGEWVAQLRGWPGYGGDDLAALGSRIVRNPVTDAPGSLRAPVAADLAVDSRAVQRRRLRNWVAALVVAGPAVMGLLGSPPLDGLMGMPLKASVLQRVLDKVGLAVGMAAPVVGAVVTWRHYRIVEERTPLWSGAASGLVALLVGVSFPFLLILFWMLRGNVAGVFGM